MDKHEIIEGIVRCVGMVTLFAFVIFFGYVITTDMEVMFGGQ